METRSVQSLIQNAETRSTAVLTQNLRREVTFSDDREYNSEESQTQTHLSDSDRTNVFCMCGHTAPLVKVKTEGVEYNSEGSQTQTYLCESDRTNEVLCMCGHTAALLQVKIEDLNCDAKTGRAASRATNAKEVSGSPSRSPNERLLSEADETNDVLCTCGYAARLLTVKTFGPNCGRQFYKCGNMNSCHFFLWADDELLALRLAVELNGVDQNFTVTCRCNKPAKLLTVEKEGPNSGRKFFGCLESCGFFQWTDSASPATNSDSDDASNNTDLPSEDFPDNPVPEKRKKKCGLCLDLGHNRIKCPRNRSRRK